MREKGKISEALASLSEQISCVTSLKGRKISMSSLTTFHSSRNEKNYWIIQSYKFDLTACSCSVKRVSILNVEFQPVGVSCDSLRLGKWR